MTLARLKWYAARLAAMSPPELAHRLREAVLKRGPRSDRRGWDRFASVGAGPLGDLSGLRAGLAAGGDLVGPAVALVRAGRLAGLGREVAADDAGCWFRDPVSGEAWPGAETYCFDIDVRATGAGRGDVKFVWEINRLQMLQPLAAEIAAEPTDERIALALAILQHWCDENPPFLGVNWFSGIELALRLVSVALLVAALPAGCLSVEQNALLRRFIAAHGYWLHRFPSKYSSANNHLVAEGLGLLLAGLLLPDLLQAPNYEAEGRAILENEAMAQIGPDGVGGEQSPTYQAFTMEMLAFGALLARIGGRPLAGSVDRRLGKGALFLRTLMDEAGLPPRIGDDDEGRVIAAPPDREPRYVASVVAAVAGLTGDAALLPPGRDAHLRDGLFGVPHGANSASDGLWTFPQGGYSVLRDHIGGRHMVLTFDHGPLGYLSLAAHGHADALALWLSLDDQPVFIDAGTWLYHSGGALRNRLRSSLAHNTLTIREASQSLPSSAFSWSLKARAGLDAVQSGDDWSIGAHHDGYRRRFGVLHRRTLARTPAGFSVLDRLDGARAHLPVSIGFLVAPGLAVSQADDTVTLARAGVPILRLQAPAGLSVGMVREDRARGMGLFSPAFGALVPASQIVFTGLLGADPAETMVEILAP